VTEITGEASKIEESTTIEESKEVIEELSPEELEKVSEFNCFLSDD
jgi:hypothetical protein